MPSTIARRLGLTPAFTALSTLSLALLALAAVSGMAVFYGVACAVALLAGAAWARQVQCETCGLPMEDDPAPAAADRR
ncbi:hypothetical protein ABZU32_39160 [Sphaerisporangium sp. NPDC005288]|uniref:hypothetical protein n=1 Tax=Sphaerisporangium sp. NPDC005288 TaxID=3155114 RepID=UPI0033A1125D